ncbi:UDP-N-acetylmuramate--L-alanine ligase [Oceanotoga sp. DSM 15011]|uniref:UDP-N-acetylmuramate--L-alanine ligase n=1 Tax=Oceanotoga sp. DSM 15011 TaxID=2984951 RepID=UPI0021F43D61|nr:UDP-N-acetylmuramate--L-alanine ligase [Oceanotoga sp. DSM 15011]UYP01090.1 UDP-N-acetylmuramate--L-alanine ligase [Oceanotoga sp. DSM 15011]
MKYYFSGIGGIGMSSLALYAKYTGHTVYGSNNEENERTNYLQNQNINIKFEQNKDIPDVDLFIKSTAIKNDNPEIIAAKEKNIKILSRMEFLNTILKENHSIGITGTDGKTTTTAMTANIFINAKKSPTVFLGGLHKSLKDGNFNFGENILISEVDESDGYIKYASSNTILVNNLRPDHLEHYDNDFENLKKSIKNYCKTSNKFLFFNYDDPILKKWKNEFQNIIYFGIDEDADYIMKNRKQINSHQEFDMYKKDIYLGKITLSMPGIHYAYDALAAASISLEYGIKFEDIQRSLKKFESVGRRFNILYSNSNKYVIDDYAHTPEEIFHTIEGAKEYFPNKKIITIFQPHRYTRLHRHKNDFVNVLKNSDEIIVYRIYSAFEDPIDGIDENYICRLLKENGKNCLFFDIDNDMIDYLKAIKESVFLFVGAGDITKVAYKLSSELLNSHIK